MKPKNGENATTETKHTTGQLTVGNTVPHFKHRLPERPGGVF